jgi:hypothetical protein
MRDPLGDWQKIWMFGSNDALVLLIAILAIDLALHYLLERKGQPPVSGLG